VHTKEPTIIEVREAAERIRPHAHRTPVLTCQSLDDRLGARVFLKCENLQKVGAFKFRGACNAVFSLSRSEAARGVVTHSSGNHAQALALAARLRGIPAHIVMPDNAAAVKRAAVAAYGGQIRLCGPGLRAREAAQDELARSSGANVVHPYDDYRVIAGQATAALEFLEEVPDLQVLMAPVGGGGLLSGTAIAAGALSGRVRVIGAEPEGADDAFRSLQAGRILPQTDPQTIADGLRSSLGTRNFRILQSRVEQIVTASESAIVEAMRFVWERTKLIIEPSAAVPLAALWEHRVDCTGLRVGVIVSGGNVDLDQLPWQG
jgi:threonine dehydratase